MHTDHNINLLNRMQQNAQFLFENFDEIFGRGAL
jgi:hypothetical protein